ncbi:1-phosphatidylinositol phosphodiesterase-like, partial [Etheostoma spectabile]|uniref:1-phosphatidylinositol phosphodiesterase-like n=1 Tax=Etheostoma spectabile TaxID=54343 RepID=UPI0013AF9AEB
MFKLANIMSSPTSITTCSGSGTGFNDVPSLDPELYNLNWMKSIPDKTPVSAISIPGTHESLSLHGGPLAKCQVWTLKDQLNVGIRYFDVHVGIWLLTQNHIYIRDRHWMFSQHIQFDEVLGTVSDFLTVHSTETVLLKVTLRGLYKRKVEEELLKKLIQKFKKKIWNKLSVPNMEQARGKIVFLQSNMFNAGTLNHESFFIKYNKLINVEEKIKQIKPHLCDHHIVLTDSAASRFESPKNVAKKVNKQLNNLVVKHKKNSLNQGCLGVLSMDFPSVDLVKNIIQLKPCNCGKGKEKGQRPDGDMPIPETTPETSPTFGKDPEPTLETDLAPESPKSPQDIELTPEPENPSSGQDSEPTPEPESIKSGLDSVPTPEQKSSTAGQDSEETTAPELTTSGPDLEPTPALESVTSGQDSEPTPSPESQTSGQDSDSTPALDSPTSGKDPEPTPAPESPTSEYEPEPTAAPE